MSYIIKPWRVEIGLFKLIFLLEKLPRSISTSALLILEIMVYFEANAICYLLNLKSA